MVNRKLKAGLVVIIGLLLGYVVAAQLSGFLGIAFIVKDLPAAVPPDATTTSFGLPDGSWRAVPGVWGLLLGAAWLIRRKARG
jgi:hypothetical protein